MTSTFSPSLFSLNRVLRRYYCSRGIANSKYLSNVVTTGWPICSPRIFAQTSPCRANSLLIANGFQKSAISTTTPKSIFSWMHDKLSERAQTKKAAKLVDQVSLMANSPTWTIKMFADEIDETLSSWTTKLPGVGRTSELQAAKESQQVVKAIIEQLGDTVTAGDISRFDRKQKLKLAIACQKSMEDLDRVLHSFTQMDIMHRILRYRRENGIALPKDEAGLKIAMQQDGMKVMTREEKHTMRDSYAKYMESPKA